MSETNEKLKVFVSYSRDDLHFAEQLVLALQERGFEPLLDRHDIDAGEKWKKRLGELIFHCDSVVFVLSAKSAASSICAWEVAEATKLGKRVIPVLPASLEDVNPPPQLSDLNYIHFYSEQTVPGSGFYDGVLKLDRALRVDLDWLREATRLAERAAFWIARGKGKAHLLRGVELEEVQEWKNRAPEDSVVQQDTQDFLAASADAEKVAAEEEEKRERALRGAKSERKKIIASAALLLTVVVGFAGTHIWLISGERTWNTLRIWALAKVGFYGGPEMIEIRPGQGIFPADFEMGSKDGDDRERPVHTVHFAKPFAIGAYEVTFDEYGAYTWLRGLEQPVGGGRELGNHPVIKVSSDEVQNYINWLNEMTGKHFRLPTEAEWEYVARAGTTTDYWWGDKINHDDKVWANCDGCGAVWDGKSSAPVGQFPANPFGLYDTAGNVSELVEDCLSVNYVSAPVDGSAWLWAAGKNCSSNVIRGGTWVDKPVDLRSATRYGVPRNTDSYWVGFRLAQDLE